MKATKQLSAFDVLNEMAASRSVAYFNHPTEMRGARVYRDAEGWWRVVGFGAIADISTHETMESAIETARKHTFEAPEMPAFDTDLAGFIR